jgi:predicted house-cleaning noncanonical NTP pyrophosphatase (MazG superfamily)
MWEDDIESSDSSDDDDDSNEKTNVYPYNDNSDNEDTSSDDSVEDNEPVNQQSQRGNFDEHETEYISISNSKKFIFNLLKRTRRLISAINNSSNLNKYVRDQIFSKQEDSNKRAKEDNTEPIRYNELISDICNRWGSTFKMLNRFNLLSSILNDVTCTPKNIDGVESQQLLKLSKLTFTHDDWNWLSALEFVLERFDKSTQLLSGRTYQTLSIGKMIINGLRHFLTHQSPDKPMINHLKTLLLPKFEEYCEEKFSSEAGEAIIVSTYII